METRERSPFFGVKTCLWITLTLPFLFSLFYFVWFKDGWLSQSCYAGSKAFLLILPLIFAWKMKLNPLREMFYGSSRAVTPAGKSSPSSHHLKSISSGIMLGGIMILAMFLLVWTPVFQVLLDGSGNIRQKAVQLGFLDHYWTFAIFLSLINSLLEEYYWRWFAFGLLRRSSPFIPSALIASIAFSLHHSVVLAQYFPLPWALGFAAATGLAGFLWCGMYERQKNLMGAWISHIMADMGIMTLGYCVLINS